MANDSTEKTSIAELKGKEYSMAAGTKGGQADKYTQVTRAIGDYVGRVFGREMKILVINGKETTHEEPEYPKNDNKGDVAMWSKKYDQYTADAKAYKKNKEKVFVIVIGQCDKAMRNRIESLEEHEEMEEKSDVIKLLRMIKDVAFDSNDRKYPPMQAAQAWKNLCLVRQGDNEELLDYYKRFMALLEMVERTYGKVSPEEVAKKENNYAKKKAETIKEAKDKMIAFMFMNGARYKTFGFMMKNLSEDYALNAGKYPETVEDALQVLTLYEETMFKKIKTREEQTMSMSFTQTETRKCWKCGKVGHVKTNCPEMKPEQHFGWQEQKTEQHVAWCD